MWFLQSGITLEYAVITIFALLMTIFLIMPIHEWAHGFIAYKLGDKTAKYSGRLTLNPLKHIDPLGATSMILFRFGWAKPVPVDPRNFKNPKRDLAITALAGPVSNLTVALIAAFIFNLLIYFGHNFITFNALKYIVFFFQSFISINVGLAVFNLIPLPPLDGSRIMCAFLPDKFLYKYYQYEGYIIFFVFFLLFTDILSLPLNFINTMVFNGIMTIANLPFKF